MEFSGIPLKSLNFTKFHHLGAPGPVSTMNPLRNYWFFHHVFHDFREIPDFLTFSHNFWDFPCFCVKSWKLCLFRQTWRIAVYTMEYWWFWGSESWKSHFLVNFTYFEGNHPFSVFSEKEQKKHFWKSLRNNPEMDLQNHDYIQWIIDDFQPGAGKVHISTISTKIIKFSDFS